MEISRRTDYGVRLILDLAGLADGKRASTQEIAERQNIPAPFLAKIISQLSLSGLVNTHRGAGGGVMLARPAGEINLLQVIEALDGPVRLNRCAVDRDAPRRNSVSCTTCGASPGAPSVPAWYHHVRPRGEALELEYSPSFP
jgi:Rrf2 family protein